MAQGDHFSEAERLSRDAHAPGLAQVHATLAVAGQLARVAGAEHADTAAAGGRLRIAGLARRFRAPGGNALTWVNTGTGCRLGTH